MRIAFLIGSDSASTRLSIEAVCQLACVEPAGIFLDTAQPAFSRRLKIFHRRVKKEGIGYAGERLLETASALFDRWAARVVRREDTEQLLRRAFPERAFKLQEIADRYGCPVLDLWSLKTIQDRRAWDGDRLHLSPEGHTRVALRAGQVLGVEVPADPDQPWPPLPPRGPLDIRRDDVHWAREYLVPWIGRRLRGESSGDHVEAKGALSPDAIKMRIGAVA